MDPLNKALIVAIWILFADVWLLATFAIARWAYRDAEARGKPGWLVSLLVLSGSGWLMWLAFQPERLRCDDDSVVSPKWRNRT